MSRTDCVAGTTAMSPYLGRTGGSALPCPLRVVSARSENLTEWPIRLNDAAILLRNSLRD